MKYFSIIVAAVFLTSAVPVWAQGGDVKAEGLEHHISIGVAGIVMPEFEGADSYKTIMYPLVEYSNRYFFVSSTKGAGVNVLRTSTLNAGRWSLTALGVKKTTVISLTGWARSKVA